MGNFDSMKHFEPSELGEQKQNVLIYPERQEGGYNF
jgi:hypothetical protein